MMKRLLHNYLPLQQFSYISYFCVKVGPADMFDIHQQLIELRKQEKELEVRNSVLLLLHWKLTKNLKVFFSIMQTLKPNYLVHLGSNCPSFIRKE